MNEELIIKKGKQLQEITEEVNERLKIPNDYIPIKLSTKGRLYAPQLFHIRNFTGKEITDITILDDESSIEATVKTLKNMIFEDDIDPMEFHPDEVIETLGIIAQSFWGQKISIDFPLELEDWEYLKDTDPEQYRLYKKKTPKLDLNLKTLKKYELPKEFKSPITITNPKTEQSVSFELNKIKHLLIAKEYLDQKDNEVDALIKPLINKFQKDESICTYEEKLKIKNYFNNKASDLVDTIKVQILLKVNGEILETVEDKIKASYELDSILWEKITNIVDTYQVGYIKDVDLKSPITNEIVTRRLSFRFIALLEGFQLPENDGFNISFG